MVKWYHKSLPSLRCGFDSRYPLHGSFHDSFLPGRSRLVTGLRTENQIYATSTEQIHSSHQHRVHAEGLLHFSVKVETSHTALPQAGWSLERF